MDNRVEPGSYTHLKLPANREGVIPGGRRLFTKKTNKDKTRDLKSPPPPKKKILGSAEISVDLGVFLKILS